MARLLTSTFTGTGRLFKSTIPITLPVIPSTFWTAKAITPTTWTARSQ